MSQFPQNVLINYKFCFSAKAHEPIFRPWIGDNSSSSVDDDLGSEEEESERADV